MTMRRFRMLPSATVVAIVGMASMATQPLFAAHGRLTPTAAPQLGSARWLIERIDGNGVVRPVRTGTTRGEAPSRVQIEELRSQLVELTNHLVPQITAMAQRGILLADVALAPNATDRRARVAMLGVTSVIEPATDGRRGKIKTFFAKGKPRLRVFMPEQDLPPARPKVITETPDGSAGTNLTGRWKIGGPCYWDPNDSGPDQCEPDPGRWKLGTEGCYFDSGDNGPDQCEPAIEATGTGNTGGYTCSNSEYGEGDCATTEQYDDMLSEIAAAEAEYDALEAEQNANDAELANFCVQNPTHPECAKP